MQYNSWSLAYRPGGWVRAEDQTGTTVYFRLEPVGDPQTGRLRIHTALMESPYPITARSWREVPYAAVEMHALSSQIREVLMRRPRRAIGLSTKALGEYFDATTDDVRVSGSVPSDVLLAGPGESEAGFKLVQPPEGRITDEWLENLALAYQWVVAEASRRGEKATPAEEIARQSGAPVRTVHRWIAEARRRGQLPKGIQGKVG